jgi:magnesium transporter
MLAPAEDEQEILCLVFHFHELAIEDAIGYSQRPKIERYVDAVTGEYYYIVIHGPDLEAFQHHLRTKEMDIFASSRFLVTIHEEKMLSIERVFERTQSDPSSTMDQGIDVLLHLIIDLLVDNYQPILDHLEEAIDKVEENAVSEPTPDLLHHIATRKRELLNLRRIVGPQREVIAQLARGEVSFIREGTRPYFRDVQDHLIRTVEMIELYRDLVLGARDIYLSSVSNNLNQIMKTLTTISVIALPLTIVTSFFGMNFEEPYFRDQRMFYAALACMVALVAGLLILFKRKRWI